MLLCHWIFLFGRLLCWDKGNVRFGWGVRGGVLQELFHSIPSAIYAEWVQSSSHSLTTYLSSSAIPKSASLEDWWCPSLLAPEARDVFVTAQAWWVTPCSPYWRGRQSAPYFHITLIKCEYTMATRLAGIVISCLGKRPFSLSGRVCRFTSVPASAPRRKAHSASRKRCYLQCRL